MPEAAAATTKCTECGLDSGAPVTAIKPGWRTRLVGTSIGVFMLAMWASYFFWPPARVMTFGNGTNGSIFFIEPRVAGADLSEIAAEPGGRRDRLVAPLARFADKNHWTRFPYSAQTIALRLMPRAGEWYRTSQFGKPFALLSRYERGPLSAESPGVPAATSIFENSMPPTVFMSGNRVAEPGRVSTSVGALSILACLVVFSGWAAATLGARFFGLRKRRRAWAVGSALALGVLVAWSFAAGEETSLVTYPACSPSAGGSGPPPLGADMVMFGIDDFTDPNQTDGHLASLLLDDVTESTPDASVAFISYPAYAMSNWRTHEYGEPDSLIDSSWMSYAELDNHDQLVPFPAHGWRFGWSAEYLLISPPADGTSTVQREYSINLGLVSLALLTSALPGFAAGAFARWCGRIPARGRRREGRCIGCGNLLSPTVAPVTGEPK
jgi:hypothetical protein